MLTEELKKLKEEVSHFQSRIDKALKEAEPVYKVGDQLMCEKDLFMHNTKLTFKKGKVYMVFEVDIDNKRIALKDEQNAHHYIVIGSWTKHFRPATQEEILRAKWEGVEYAKRIKKSLNDDEEVGKIYKKDTEILLNHKGHNCLLDIYYFEPATKEEFEKQNYWKPENKDSYFYPYYDIKPTEVIWDNDPTDLERYKHGLVFRTEEHAKEATKAIRELLQQLQVKFYNRRTDGK